MRYGVTVTGLLVLCSCSTSKDVAIAKQATEAFHRQAWAGRADAIYDSADWAYQQTTSREANRGFLSRIRRKMGDCHDSGMRNYFANFSTNATYVTLGYRTKCVNGELNERLTWRTDGVRPTLVRYEANSALLLTD